MSTNETLERFKELLKDSISENSFVKLSLGNYQGNDASLKKLHIRKIKVKRADVLSFNYKHKTRDIFKNFEINEIPYK